MSGLSNAQLAQQVSTLVSAWNEREAQFRDWLGGTATGGPNGDGKYPLTDSLGKSSLVDCPARLASTVSGPKADAEAAKLAAQAAQAAALGYATTADQQRVLGQAALAAALAARDLSLQYRDRAANAEANALVYKNAAEAAAAGLAVARDAAVQANTDAQAAKVAAAGSASAAAASAALAATFNPANFAAKVHTHAITDVTGLQAALDAKLAASGFTWAELPGKPSAFAPAAHSHVIADVTGLQAALDARALSTAKAPDAELLDGRDSSGFLQISRGIRADQQAWTDTANFGVDAQVGDGLFNLTAGAYHASRDTASATGHRYISARGASRIGMHDNTFNFYVGDKGNGAATAGQSVTWSSPVLALSATAASFGVNGIFPASISVGANVATGLYGDGGNVAIRTYGGASLIYFQNAGGASTLGTWGTGGFNVSTPLGVAGNVVATGSMFVGASGGLFVNGQNHRLFFDGAGGTRVNYRSDHATAAGFNLTTNDGAFRGALYYDGSLGLLNQNNGWRLRTHDTYLSIYSNAGVEYQIWGQHNLSPMTLTSGQLVPNSSGTKEFQTKAGDVLGSSVGQTYAGSLGVIGPGSSDPNNHALMSFHRPGNYAAHFGLDQNNRFVVGGWSMGNGVKNALWINNQIPTGVWQNTDDGKNRFLFIANSDSYWKSATGHIWRTGSDATTMTLDANGNLNVFGELYHNSGHWIRKRGGEGIYWEDYGGGWHMTDASYMRSYNGKHVYTAGVMQADSGMVSQGGRVFRHGDGAFGSSAIFMSTAGPSGGASGDIWFQYS